MKLKTLNELSEANSGYVSKELLRQEAIKWIKKLMTTGIREIFNEDCVTFDINARIDNIINQIEWIKNFFNITEGDLE